jgi:hypothetical protein
MASLEARRATLVHDNAETRLALQRATEAETRAFEASNAAWRLVADTCARIEETAQGASPETIRKIRWSRARALVRAGDIWAGIGELESILADASDREGGLVRATREQLGAAYYYGARLMRLAGEPDSEWLIETGKARQHFRYLAERADSQHAARDHQRNVELVLNLEQEGRFALEGKPLPKDSPSRCNGTRPNAGRKNKRPPNNRDSRGAGGAEDIYTGW